MILALRTDAPEAEVTFVNDTGEESTFRWLADRQLARHLLRKIEEYMGQVEVKWSEITGIIVFTGPGSYTGLRIGVTVASSIAYAWRIPIVGTNGDEWKLEGKARLERGESDSVVLPEYGNGPHITQPRK